MARLIDRIEYKRLHEREMGRGQYEAESPLIYTILTIHMHTHTHPTHMRTHTNFSDATEPRTDMSSKGKAFQNELPSQPMNRPNTRIEQPDPNLAKQPNLLRAETCRDLRCDTACSSDCTTFFFH